MPTFGDILRKARSCKKVDPSLNSSLNFQNFGTFGDKSQREELSTMENLRNQDHRRHIEELLMTKAVSNNMLREAINKQSLIKSRL